MAGKLARAEILAQIPVARAAGREAEREPWWPAGVRYDERADAVVIAMRGGKTLTVPRAHLPELKHAKQEQLERVELAGDAIRWDELDVDIAVPGLLAEVLGARLSTRESGRMGGKARSKAKAAAARENGAKGGRPRKRT